MFIESILNTDNSFHFTLLEKLKKIDIKNIKDD